MPEYRLRIIIEGRDEASPAIEKSKNALSGLSDMGKTVIGVAAAVGLFKLGKAALSLGVESALAASRVQEMNAVLPVVARNAGVASEEVFRIVDAVKEQGIQTDIAQQTVAQFARYELDMAKAADLARVAQDAAVMSMQNSTQALDGLIYGITTYNTRVLRTYGINVQMEKAFETYGKTIGKAADDLDSAERAQAALNAVLAAGGTIAGAYSAAMEEPGKRLRSLERYVYEAKVALGEVFLPVVGSVADGGKRLTDVIIDNKEAFQALLKPVADVAMGAVGLAVDLGTVALQFMAAAGAARDYENAARDAAGQTREAGSAFDLGALKEAGELAEASAKKYGDWAEYLRRLAAEHPELAGSLAMVNNRIGEQHRKIGLLEGAFLALTGRTAELNKNYVGGAGGWALTTAGLANAYTGTMALNGALGYLGTHVETVEQTAATMALLGIATAKAGDSGKYIVEQAVPLDASLMGMNVGAMQVAGSWSNMTEKGYALGKAIAWVSQQKMPGWLAATNTQFAVGNNLMGRAVTWAKLYGSNVGNNTNMAGQWVAALRLATEAQRQEALATQMAAVANAAASRAIYANAAALYTKRNALLADIAAQRLQLAEAQKQAARGGGGVDVGAQIREREKEREQERIDDARKAALEIGYRYQDMQEFISDNAAQMDDALRLELTDRMDRARAEADATKETNAQLALDLLDAERSYQEEKLAIATDESLSDEERAARLAILDRENAEEVQRLKERAELEAQIEEERWAKEVEAMRAAGAAGGDAFVEEIQKGLDELEARLADMDSAWERTMIRYAERSREPWHQLVQGSDWAHIMVNQRWALPLFDEAISGAGEFETALGRIKQAADDAATAAQNINVGGMVARPGGEIHEQSGGEIDAPLGVPVPVIAHGKEQWRPGMGYGQTGGLTVNVYGNVVNGGDSPDTGGIAWTLKSELAMRGVRI